MAYVHRDFSPSSISEWKQCPRKWGHVRIDRLIPPDKTSTALGTAVHARLEAWFKLGVHPTTEPGDAGEIAESGLHLWPAPGSVVFDIERGINAELDGFSFVGTQDIGYWEPEATGVDPAYVVGDHKTTSDFKWAKTAADLEVDPQGLIYSLAAMQRFGVETVKAQWGYLLTKPGRRKAKATQTTFHRADVEAAMREHIIPVAALIRKAREENAEATDLPQNPNACMMFGGCFFQDKCSLTPMQRMKAAMAQETIKDKMERIKREQAAAAGLANTVKAVEAEADSHHAPSAINPPERPAPGSLVAKLMGGKAASGPSSATEAPAPEVAPPAPPAAPDGGKESITDRIKRIQAEKAATAAPTPPPVQATPPPAPKTAPPAAPKVQAKTAPTPPPEAPSGAPSAPFVLCVGCAPIGQCTNAFAALDLIHREFCEANEVSDFRQLPFNRNGDFAAFFDERFDSCHFSGFVVVDPRLPFVKECIPSMERRANYTVRALAF